MHRRTWPIELLLLAFLAVFLVYPLGYIVPGSASDEEYAVRLTALGELPEQKAQVLLVLAKNGLDQQARFALRLPHMVRTFPPARKSSAEQLADDIRAAGGQV